MNSLTSSTTACATLDVRQLQLRQPLCERLVLDELGREFANGLEHGYYYGSVDGDFTGKAVMIDAPNWYLDGDAYEWNGTTMIWTGSWSTNDLSRVYPRYTARSTSTCTTRRFRACP